MSDIQIKDLFQLEETKLLLSPALLMVAKFDVEVFRDSKLYSPNGLYLRVNYNLYTNTIESHYLLEKHTDKYLKYQFSDSELVEKVICDIHSKLKTMNILWSGQANELRI